MHDWKKEVAGNLKNIGLPAREQEEVITELADYMQDRYEQALAEGMSDSEAVECCLDEAAGWRRMGQRIRRAKREEGVMNHRTKTLWVPGLASLTLASVLLMALQRMAFLQPRIIWKDGGALVFYFAWWLLLPLCGAAGAYLSRRAGGRGLISVAAGLFPAIVMFAAFCVFLPVSIFVERNAFVMQHPTLFALTILNWTLIPALALLVGAAPVRSRASQNELNAG